MSFQQGLSGLNAAAKSLEVTGNNVANASTVGFKGSQARFADMYAASLQGAGATHIGIGTRLVQVAQQFTQGNISTTNNPLDVAINGVGFFVLQGPAGEVFSRNGQFQLDRNGYIVSTTGARLMGYPAGGGSVPEVLQFNVAPMAANPTTEAQATLNFDSRMDLPAVTPFDLNNPQSYNNSTAVTVFDSLGNAHVVQQYFVKTAGNTWDVYASMDGQQIGVGSQGTLRFSESGRYLPSTVPGGSDDITLNVPIDPIFGSTSPLSITMDFSNSTQFGANFSVYSMRQDGYTSGQLASFHIAPDGHILGRYTNGATASLGQIALAHFDNPNGLQPFGDNVWKETAESGQPQRGRPGEGLRGLLQSAAVEESNVDLTAELVNMISAQRVYQANAQTIKTQDQIMQTLVNMR